MFKIYNCFKQGGIRKMENEKATGMKRLWELATVEKGLVYVSCVLSALSTLASFIPFVAVYFIIIALFDTAENVSGINGI